MCDDDRRGFERKAGSLVHDKAKEISLNESMLWVVGAGVALILVVAAVTALGRKNRGVGAPWPVYAKRLLGEREQVLYWRLVGAFPKHVVLARCRFLNCWAFRRALRIGRPFQTDLANCAQILLFASGISPPSAWLSWMVCRMTILAEQTLIRERLRRCRRLALLWFELTSLIYLMRPGCER